jgi:hypothetical protein
MSQMQIQKGKAADSFLSNDNLQKKLAAKNHESCGITRSRLTLTSYSKIEDLYNATTGK